jgi:hypothetical protein
MLMSDDTELLTAGAAASVWDRRANMTEQLQYDALAESRGTLELYD